MGIVNWLIHRNMRKEAQILAKWAVDSYQVVRAQNPQFAARDIFRKMLDQKVKFPGGESDREKVLDRYGSSLHGLCYYLGLNSILMKGMMISRCLQFTEYIDKELQKHGTEQLPIATKKNYFKMLDLPDDAVGKSYL